MICCQIWWKCLLAAAAAEKEEEEEEVDFQWWWNNQNKKSALEIVERKSLFVIFQLNRIEGSNFGLLSSQYLSFISGWAIFLYALGCASFVCSLLVTAAARRCRRKRRQRRRAAVLVLLESSTHQVNNDTAKLHNKVAVGARRFELPRSGKVAALSFHWRA